MKTTYLKYINNMEELIKEFLEEYNNYQILRKSIKNETDHLLVNESKKYIKELSVKIKDTQVLFITPSYNKAMAIIHTHFNY